MMEEPSNINDHNRILLQSHFQLGNLCAYINKTTLNVKKKKTQICSNLEISSITLLLQIQMMLSTLTYIDVLNYSGGKDQPV